MVQHIMLSYYKHINCQQSFAGLFEAISKELVELDLASRRMDIIWELIGLVCSIAGTDFIDCKNS